MTPTLQPLSLLALLTAAIFSSNAAAIDQEITIGTFDAARGGAGSIDTGSYWSGVKPEILANYCPTFLTTNTLTPEFLDQLDVVSLISPWSGTMQVQPLSQEEQDALLAFVMNGGGAIILTDNTGFDSADASFLTPFGMSDSGTISGVVEGTIDDVDHPIANGLCGTVLSFAVGFPGRLTNLNQANPLGSWNSGGTALAVLEKDVLAPGSGSVVFGADRDFVNTIAPAQIDLFMNMLAHVSPQPESGNCCPADTNADDVVDIGDLLDVIVGWGPCTSKSGCCPSDINGDGETNVNDLLETIVAWGNCHD